MGEGLVMEPSAAQTLASCLLPALATARAELTNLQAHPDGRARLLVEHGGQSLVVTVEAAPVELPKMSSGANWTRDEEEQLRVLWVELCGRMEGRSEAAVRARLATLGDRHHGVWPEGFRESRGWSGVGI